MEKKKNFRQVWLETTQKGNESLPPYDWYLIFSYLKEKITQTLLNSTHLKDLTLMEE